MKDIVVIEGKLVWLAPLIQQVIAPKPITILKKWPNLFFTKKEDLPLHNNNKGKRITVPKNNRKNVICIAGKLFPTNLIEISHKLLKKLAQIVQNIP